MTVRSIVRLGHPALRSPAEEVGPEELSEVELQTLIDDMLETMADAGGVGLAAPQLGLSKQLFVYLAVGEERNMADAAPRILINPMLEPVSGELVYDWEGCLSIPDLRGLVPRYPELRVHALDRSGQPIHFTAEGYESRIIQHEFDHLNGVVFLDRMRDLRSLAFGAEWQEFMTIAAGERDSAPGAGEESAAAEPSESTDLCESAESPEKPTPSSGADISHTGPSTG